MLVVAQVRNISTQSTNITYKVDDGTAELEVKKWVDSATADSMDMDERKTPGDEIVRDGYIRVLGSIKAFGHKRYIGAHSVRPVKDVNEVNCHMVEATAVHLYFTRGPPGAAGAGAGLGAGDGGEAYSRGEDVYGASLNKTLMASTPLARRVYELLRTEPQDDTGLHLQQIASKLNLPATDVARAGEELLNSGMIFSTMDEQTWAILEYSP